MTRIYMDTSYTRQLKLPYRELGQWITPYLRDAGNCAWIRFMLAMLLLMAAAERVVAVPTCGELVLEGKGLWLGHLDGLTA